MNLEKILIFILSALFFMIVIWITYQSFLALCNSYKTRNWNTTTAAILSCSVAETEDQDGTNYKANISYSYAVNGIEYISNNIAFIGLLYMSSKVATFQTNQFPENSTTTVYYNPNNHSESVLIPGFTRLQVPSAVFLFAAVITTTYLMLIRLGVI